MPHDRYRQCYVGRVGVPGVGMARWGMALDSDTSTWAIPLGPSPCTKALVYQMVLTQVKGQSHQSRDTQSRDPRPEIQNS